MNTELQILSGTMLPTPAEQPTFSQVGDKNVQVGRADNVNQVINIIVPGSIRSAISPTIASGIRLNTDYYNLFVIGNEAFDSDHFILPKDRALTESIAPEIKSQFARLSEDAIAQIKTFPALFASENHLYGQTDDAHTAYVGVVTEIRIQENGIKIYFRLLSPLPQQRLNALASNLALGRASFFNELNRTHWTIKRINLMEELATAGLSVFR